MFTNLRINDKKLFIIPLIFILLIDISFVLTKDFVQEDFISIYHKIIIFIIISYLCLFFQYLLLKKFSGNSKLINNKNNEIYYSISYIGIIVIGFLIGILIFQILTNNYYNKFALIATISSCYIIPIIILTKLLFLFISWQKLRHSRIIDLHILSIMLIIINLTITIISTDLIIKDRPTNIRPYVGGNVVISSEKYLFNDLIQISSTLSFISLWITTVILMYNYNDKKVKKIIFWISISLPVIYYLISYFYQFILVDFLNYLNADSTLISISYNSFLTISGPLEGLAFIMLFLRLSKNFKQDKNIRFYITITAYGVLLLFTANQAEVLNDTPFPPFGLITITILNLASLLMLVGIYNSAFLISINKPILETIQKYLKESKLLGIIGEAERAKEINKTIEKILNDKVIEENDDIKIEENELKIYMENVLKELQREKASSD